MRIEFLRAHWDRIAGWAAVAAGALALVLGWYGASGTPYPAAQLPYVASGGLGGLFLLGLGAVLLLSADLRDEWVKLDRIEQRLAADATPGSPYANGHGAEAPHADASSGAGGYVGGNGGAGASRTEDPLAGAPSAETAEQEAQPPLAHEGTAREQED